MPDGIGRHGAPRRGVGFSLNPTGTARQGVLEPDSARLALKGNPVELTAEELRTILENAY